jgi:glycosyltransferase involved in cell wall biosynthesis
MTAYAPQAAIATSAAPPAAGLPGAAPRPLRIAIVSEGCYPFHPGGVSLWCHQLIQGMPENSFTVVALTVDGTEQSTWPAPGNLTEAVNIPLWGQRPRPRRRPPASFTGPYESLLRSMFGPLTQEHETACADEFVASLRGLYEYAQVGDLAGAMVQNDSIDRLRRAWHQAGLDSGRPGSVGPLTLRDAFASAERVEHMLRPLSRPPVRTQVCHLAMNGLSALVGLTSKWAYGTPIVLSEHGVYLRERYLSLAAEDAPRAVKGISTRFSRRLVVGAYQNADILAPHSTYNRRWQLYSGADPARMRTMYNGVNPADFPAAEGEPEDPTIVFVGRIDPLKDLHTLIRAFAIVRERIPNARLRMFGPVSSANERYHASCEQLITELGLSGAAVFEGAIARQTDAYEAGHLVALTSVSEGFPFTVVESMSMGRPPVCTNVGGVSEAVGKDVGFVVPPRDHAAVADACIRLLEDADLRHSCGARARERVLERFTLSQWTNAYREIYAALVPAVTSDARVSPAGDVAQSARQAFDPGTAVSTPGACSRIPGDLADIAHSHGLDTRAPRQENGDETRSEVRVHHEETPGRAINGRPVNGSSRQADAPPGTADAVPEPVDGPAGESLVMP